MVRIGNRASRDGGGNGFLPWAMSAVAVIGIFAVLPAAAQPTRSPAHKPTPPPALSEKEAQIDALAKAWSAFYAGKYPDAVKTLDPLFKAKDESARVEAAYLQGRCFWATGNKDDAARAQQSWAAIQKASTLTTLKQRLQIVKALNLEGEGDAKVPQAIEVLQELLKGEPGGTVSAEAAIELGRLQVKAKQFEEAKKSLEFVGGYLDKKNLTRLEIPEPLAAPFIAAAKKALGSIRYEKDAGRKEFEEAEKLRKAEKFVEAAKAYQAILKDFPSTDYAVRSDLSLGYCLLGDRKPMAAAEHWKKFIKAGPAGNWRGQAYVGLTDLLLDEMLDLAEAGKYADLAASSLPTGLGDEKTKESWEEVRYDIYLRVGTVAYIQGKGQTAADAFEQAKKALPPKATAAAVESLDSLIAAAKGGKAVIPEDVGKLGAPAGGSSTPADKPAVALAVGTIYDVARRYEAAEAFFDRVSGHLAIPPKEKGEPGTPAAPPMSGATPAQISFALFGRAAALEGQDDPKKKTQVKELLLASIKTCQPGSWHDETLYRLATIVQGDAENSFGQKAVDRAKAEAEKQAKDGGGRAGPAKAPTARDREAQAKAEKDRLDGLKKALAEAVPYWVELVKRYPDSPRCEEAELELAMLCRETGDRRRSQEWASSVARRGEGSPLFGQATFLLLESETRNGSLEKAEGYWKSLERWLSDKHDFPPRVASAWGCAPSAISEAERWLSMRTRVLPHAIAVVGLVSSDWPTYRAFLYPRMALYSTAICVCSERFDLLPPLAKKVEEVLLKTEMPRIFSLPALIERIAANKRTLAESDDLKHFNERSRMILCLAELSYCVDDAPKAVEIIEEMLSGLHGPLDSHATAYLKLLMANCVYRLEGKVPALAVLEEVLGKEDLPAHGHLTALQKRAAYAFANVGLESQDRTQAKKAQDLLVLLSSTDDVDEYSCKAKVLYAYRLTREGNDKEAAEVLQRLAKADESIRALATFYVDCAKASRHRE